MKVELIAAHDQEMNIGYNGKLPWENIPGDLSYFRTTTIGHAVLMGRKTWDSLPKKPLDGRHNLVITTNEELLKNKILYTGFFTSIKEGLDLLKEIGYQKTVFVIGGASIYSGIFETEYLPEKLHITEFKNTYVGDVQLPDMPMEKYCLDDVMECELYDRFIWRLK